MRPPLFATTASAWRPTGGEGNPFAASGAHVAPPSVDLKIAGARLGGGSPGAATGCAGSHGATRVAPREPAAGYSVAKNMPAVPGTAAIDGHPARSSTKSTFVHV